jgi:hypothetical protein
VVHRGPVVPSIVVATKVAARGTAIGSSIPLDRWVVGVVRQARSRLDEATTEPVGVVDTVIDALWDAAHDPSCPDAHEVLLLDLRDRLSSYSLAARTLGELEVDPGVVGRLVRRGLDEVLDVAPERLAAAAR